MSGGSCVIPMIEMTLGKIVLEIKQTSNHDS